MPLNLPTDAGLTSYFYALMHVARYDKFTTTSKMHENKKDLFLACVGSGSLFHAPPRSFVPLTVCRTLYDYQMSVWKLPRNEKEGDRITRWQFDAVRAFAWTFTCRRLLVVVIPDAQKLC